MKQSLSRKTCLLGCLALCLVGVTVANSGAAEPARKFLQGLRERGYYDTAVEYLESMKTSRLAPVELREILLYEIGVTLIEASRAQRDMAIREKQLDEANDALQRFVGQHPNHPLASSANAQLGNLLVERARIKVEQSKNPRADKAALLAEAKKIYDDAYAVFARSQVGLKEKIAPMQSGIDPNDKAKIELRDQLRQDYLQAQLLAAAIREEAAETATRGSQAYMDMLAEAAEDYGAIYEKYRQKLAGLYARMYQGRCNQKIGKYKDALSYYDELLDQPDSPDAFRTLKTKTLALAVECWMASKPPLYAEAVKRLEPWVKGVRPNEAKAPDWLLLRFTLGKAQWERAQVLKKANKNDPEARRLEKEAQTNVRVVSREQCDWQQAATDKLVEWGASAPSQGDKPEPKTFAEASQAGRESLQMMDISGKAIKALPGRIQNEKDDAVKADLQNQLDEAQQTVVTSLEDAKTYYRLALSLADKGTDSRDINLARYFLCFLYYSGSDFYDAAIVGDFVARRDPDSPGARQCAKIAMASYLKLYTAADEDDRDFASERIIEIANFISTKWPDQPEAVEALNTLIPFMIQAGDLDAAEKYLNDIPEDSPKRGQAEIKTGQAMWSEYLQGMQKLRDLESGEATDPAATPPDKAALDQLKLRAQQVLEGGVNRMKQAGQVDQSTATAALSLAQIYVDTGQTDKAVALLEDAQVGPLALVNADSPATEREGYAAEVYKTALRAYISSLATATDADAVIKKATGVMDAMKAAIDQKQLISIYVSLARDLEKQMELAAPATKKALSKGFETFLKRLRSGATDFSVLNWVAETFSSLASGFDTGQQLTAEAKQYYEEAATTYDVILDKVEFEDPNLRTQVRLRQAMTKLRLFKFTAARDTFKEILLEKESMLNVQVEAAKMYQQWASFPGKEDLYMKAMAGSEANPKTGKNIIWGWGRLFQITAKYPEFRNVFHEARYNLAICRYEYGRAKKSPNDQKEQFQKAKSAIIQTQKLYGVGPEWEAWAPKYDAMLKKIQKVLREPTVGLPKSEPAAAPK